MKVGEFLINCRYDGCFFLLVVGRSLERFVIAYETHLTVYAFYEFVCDYFLAHRSGHIRVKAELGSNLITLTPKLVDNCCNTDCTVDAISSVKPVINYFTITPQ